MAQYKFHTPSLPRDSTVFMTPSSSSGKPAFLSKSRVTPPAFSLLTPDSTPIKRAKTAQGSTDVLSELYKSGVPHIVETILAMLSPTDLCSALQVSQTWNGLVSSNSQCMTRIKEHRKSCKQNVKTAQGSTDVLSELYMRGVPHIVETILAMLSPTDLCSALQVSQTWNGLISSNSQCMTRIKEHRKSCKQNAENSEAIEKSTTALFHPPRQRALSIIDLNSQISTSLNIGKMTPALFRNFTAPATQKFRPCPNCQSPAKELTFRRSECTNTNCRFDFCQQCLMSWHEEKECSRKMRRSPAKRPCSERIAGTSKSKKRLRRL